MPEPRTLLLLRHGQTEWNAQRRAQGHRDVPLDAAGESQARRVAPILAALDPVFVRSSDLARARVTAEAIAEVAGLEVETDARLREFHLGERTGWTMDDYARAHPEEYARYRAGEYDVAPGAESRADLLSRTIPALDDALAATGPGELGIVVAHGAALKVTVAVWVGMPAEAALSFSSLGNTHWALVQDAPAGERSSIPRRLVAWNRHA